MDSRHREGDGVSSNPSPVTPTVTGYQHHSTHNMRDSQASSATNASTSSSGSHAPPQSITIATSDRGVVSVNLADLSNALGVRRSDVVSQRLMFQSRSAPSYRIDRSLLGSAVGSPSSLGSGATAATTTPTATAPSASNAHLQEASTANATSAGNGAMTATLTPPLVPRPAPYHRRHSTLRGTQLDGDSFAPPTGSTDAATFSSSFSRRLLPPRRGTPPPPGGANALRRALAGGRAGFVMSGSVPSPLRGSAGLLGRSGGALPPVGFRFNRHRNNSSCNNNNNSSSGEAAAVPHRSDSESDADERMGLLAASAASARDRAATPAQRSSTSSAGTPTPPPMHPFDEPVTGADVGSATSPSRSVHFSENVIESISVAPDEDAYMRLLVVYSRPWYAYVLLAVFGFLLGLAFLSNLYLERQQTLVKDRATSVPFLLFLTTGIGTVGMLAHLVAVWRPDNEEEQSFFEDPEQRGQLPQLLTLALFFIGGLTAALVFSQAIGTTVAVVMVVSLVGHLAAERALGDGADEAGEYVTRWDGVGCALACVGAMLAAASGAMKEILARNNSGSGTLQEELLMLVGWGLSVVIAGICWTFFTRRLREMSQRVSQQFLLTSSLGVCTVLLGIGSYVADVMLSSDGTAPTSAASAAASPRQPQVLTGVLVPCYSLFPDLIILLGGGLCFLLCWYAYHTVSFYVDHITGAACMTIGAALSTTPFVVLLGFRSWPTSKQELWVTWLALSVAGTLALVLGAGMVVYGGVRSRREAEIRIVVE